MAAFDYVQDFDGLSTANLGGQDSWSGSDADLAVQTSVVLQGTKSVISTNTYATSQRTITTADSGIWYFQIQCNTAPSSGDGMFVGFKKAGVGYMTAIKFVGTAPLKVQYYSAGAYSDLIASANTSTMYWIGLDYDGANSRFKYRYGTSAGWSIDWSAYVATGTASLTEINQLELSQDSGTHYLDNFTTTEPTFGGGASLASKRIITIT